MKSISSFGTLLAVLAVAVFACRDEVEVGADDSGATTLCAAAGGTCVLGGAACQTEAPSSAQDCNPDLNPGGAFCCLDKGTTDGGNDCAGQVAPPCAAPPPGCSWEGPECVDGHLGCGTLVCADAGSDGGNDCAGQVAPPCAAPPPNCEWQGPECVDGHLGCGTVVCSGLSDAGTTCVEIDTSSYPTSCTTASDCALISGSGKVCNGSCDCGDFAVNQAGEQKFEAATSGLHFETCPCPDPGELACVGGACVVELPGADAGANN
jgi:hypothetical protein